MCRKGQTVVYNGVEYRLTLKGRIFAAWLTVERALRCSVIGIKRMWKRL